MRLPLLVGLQQRFGAPIQFLSEEVSKGVAESKAIQEYIERRAYMVCVLELDKDLLQNTEKVNIILKIERTCKCLDIQRHFNYEKALSYLLCVACRASFGGEELINVPEQASTSEENSDFPGSPILLEVA